MNEAVGCEVKKREKHIELHEAIQGMDSIYQKLGYLLERIEGLTPEVSKCAGIDGEQPLFIDVLTGGGIAIREKTESVHQRIDRLIELLF